MNFRERYQRFEGFGFFIGLAIAETMAGWFFIKTSDNGSILSHSFWKIVGPLSLLLPAIGVLMANTEPIQHPCVDTPLSTKERLFATLFSFLIIGICFFVLLKTA
jgi:hypothetical protein